MPSDAVAEPLLVDGEHIQLSAVCAAAACDLVRCVVRGIRGEQQRVRSAGLCRLERKLGARYQRAGFFRKAEHSAELCDSSLVAGSSGGVLFNDVGFFIHCFRASVSPIRGICRLPERSDGVPCDRFSAPF